MRDREYFDLELKTQSKANLAKLARLAEFGGVEHDRHEWKYFSGSQAWRNPLSLRVSFPFGKRWDFMRATKMPLQKPPKVQLGILPERGSIPLRGNHENLSERRRYVMRAREEGTYVKDFSPDGRVTVLQGSEAVKSVLDGGLKIFH